MSTLNLEVEELKQKPIEEKSVEIVERKGKGHPDYIADSVSEAVSKALCKYYLDEFGRILHHNVDKGLVIGGRAKPFFGGGYVIEPINIIVAGRAITEVVKKDQIVPIPVSTLALDAIKDTLRNCFRFLDVDRDVIVQAFIRRGSSDLINIFDTREELPLANDTSFGVCYAPLSQVENLVLETEQYLNSKKLKKELPEVGEDIKVMGVRRGRSVVLTIAAPLISKLVPDMSHYLNIKEEIRNRILDLAVKRTDYDVEVFVNTADKPERGIIYLTVTGTSAEQGDDGNTGRGNRINGLITPCREMSLEATAGKNPVNHVGKIYNVLAKLIAERVNREVNGVREVYVKILSQIGKPINEPCVTNIQLILENNYSLNQAYQDIESIVSEEFEKLTDITRYILEDKVTLF